MVFSFQQGWDLPSATQMTLVFSPSHMPQKETSEKAGMRETEAQGTTEEWQQRVQNNHLMSFQHRLFEHTYLL